uniref:Uncharacterized protein n=1 Tax=Bacteriophage sp. TaxID=38018 RepID=A0A8D9PEC7_9VIRU|nr:MAG TPA: hypothetical protein [Bacteriophage sp.]
MKFLGHKPLRNISMKKVIVFLKGRLFKLNQKNCQKVAIEMLWLFVIFVVKK